MLFYEDRLYLQRPDGDIAVTTEDKHNKWCMAYIFDHDYEAYRLEDV